MTLCPQNVYDLTEATWPPARAWEQDGWMLRDGAGGGQRVSAATQIREGADIDLAESEMMARDGRALFMIRVGDDALDAALESRGYRVKDPVNLYAAPIGLLTDVPIPKVTAFSIWEPLAIMNEIWLQGGIGPDRIAVMARAATKTGILCRLNEKPAGVAFAAVHEGACMVHAVETLPHQRRQGAGRWLMRKAAFWAQEHGAQDIAVLCTQANSGANALYASLGMGIVGQYHYRILGT